MSKPRTRCIASTVEMAPGSERTMAAESIDLDGSTRQEDQSAQTSVKTQCWRCKEECVADKEKRVILDRSVDFWKVKP